MEQSSRFGSTLGLSGRRMDRPRHLPARSLSSQQLAPSSPSARRVRQLLELGNRLNCPNPNAPSNALTPGSRQQRHLDINPNGNYFDISITFGHQHFVPNDLFRSQF